MMKDSHFLLFSLLINTYYAVMNSFSDPVSSTYHTQYLNSHGRMDSFMKDLTQQWKPMNISESLQYFTSYDVCSVFTSRRSDFCQERFGMNASLHSGSSASCPVAGKGMKHINDVCPNLYGTFYRHSSSTNPPPKGRTIVDFMITSMYHGYDTLMLVGDSLTRQHYYDLYCQLYRYGVDVSIYGDTIFVSNLDKFVMNHKIDYLERVKEKERQKKEGESSSSSSSDTSLLKHTTFVIRFNTVYNLYMWHKQVGWVQSILSKQSDASVIVLFNLGLHFNYDKKTSSNQTELETFYHKFFQYSFNKLIKKHQQIVFFRETSAQHFPTVNRAFDDHNFSTSFTYDYREDPIKQLYDKDAEGDGKQGLVNERLSEVAHGNIEQRFPHKAFFTECVPILTKEQYDSQNWRNILAEKVLREFDPDHQAIPIIPFYSVTAGRHDLHYGGSTEDCTHYCHGPMLWLPVIHEMTLQIEKKFA
jgi:hypothetical protein